LKRYLYGGYNSHGPGIGVIMLKGRIT